MKVVCFANNVVGLAAVKHLRQIGEDIVMLVVHEPDEQKLTDEIISAANVAPENVFTGGQLKQPESVERMVSLQPDCGVSAFFGHIFRRNVIDVFPRGIVNLHTSMLPYNRGSYPNVWTIVEKTPAGVSMHLVDEGVDTGPVLAQAAVAVSPADTGLSLNLRLESAMIELFEANWGLFVEEKLQPLAQDNGAATTHRAADTNQIDGIDLDADYRAGDLLNILRARTCPPHRGAYFEKDGKRYYMRLEIEEE